MRAINGRQALWLVALLILAIGLVAAIGTVRDLQASRPRFSRSLEELRMLRGIETRMSRYQGARDACEALPSAKLADPRELLARVLPNVRADEGKEERSSAAPGWTLRRKEFVFGAAPFAKVMDFVEAAESARPPWRMVRCTLRAASPQGGSGQAAIVLEALEKTP